MRGMAGLLEVSKVPRDFHPEVGPWSKFAPAGLQAALSMPTPVARDMRGRVELTIGRLGAGKTTWGALRATRLARGTGRQLATNGIGWPDEWHPLHSFDAMEDLRDAVVVWDELHLMLPSSRGLLGKDHERFLIRWLSLLRKRGICVIGTTQAWTRCATHYRQLVTTVWVAEPVQRGRLHRARAFDPPEDGGKQVQPAQWYGPAAARIPTNALVWTGIDGLDQDEAAAGASPSAALTSSVVESSKLRKTENARDPGAVYSGVSKSGSWYLPHEDSTQAV